MRFVFLLAILALSSASTLYGVQKEILVNDDGIVVKVPGKIVVIEKPRDDEKGMQVIVKEQDRLMRKIKIDRNKQIVKEIFFSVENELPGMFSDEEHNKETTIPTFEDNIGQTKRSECNDIQGSTSQMACLVTIFRKYEGIISEDRFKGLLKDIKVAVDNNECHQLVLEILKTLEVKTTVHTLLNPLFWRLHWNIKQVPARDLEDMTQDRRENLKTDMYGSKEENQLNLEQQTGRQIELTQQIPKNRQEELDDTTGTTDGLFRFTRYTDCTKEAMSKQLAYHNNIREIQGKIFQYQLTAQQLQLQQQFLNNQKQQVKLQIMTGKQTGMSSMQMQELHRVRNEMQKKEQHLLETQKNLHMAVQTLQQELTRQEERLQQCLEDERKGDERHMSRMF